ncbi:Protein ZINC INDUCED FACILITATOR-LIKE 1 [Hordeum vulgare]|nr:Protein ZINC INDUCED FACILITATOR-LIKE 1 [Hordeum vulgare]
MVRGAKRRGCLPRTEDTSPLDLPNLNQAAMPNQHKNSDIDRAIITDTGSSQDSVFKKEDNTETSSLSGPREWDLEFPVSSKKGTSEGLGSAFKKEATPTGVAAASIGKPNKDISLT